MVAERPFAVTGLDFAGPFPIKIGKEVGKIWICVFTCLVSRAIHFEIAHDLTAAEFLKLLKNLGLAYCIPKIIVSDNATNFVCANKLLQKWYEQKELKTTLAKRGITWKHIPSRSALFGGIYERMVGLLKTQLTFFIRGHTVSIFELENTLKEIKWIINSRPLIRCGDEEVLTPHHILTGYPPEDVVSMQYLLSDRVLEEAMRLRGQTVSIWRKAQDDKSKFWQTFMKQYLDSIRYTKVPGKAGSGLSPKIGDLVIIYDSTPRYKWDKGIVTELVYSEDKVVRSCKVRCKGRIITRAISLLYPLELTAESYQDTETKNKANYFHNVNKSPNEFKIVKEEDKFVPAAPMEDGKREDLALKVRKSVQNEARDKRAANRTRTAPSSRNLPA